MLHICVCADRPRTIQLLEVAEGLDYLHSEGVIHGDLRGVNTIASVSFKHPNPDTTGKSSH